MIFFQLASDAGDASMPSHPSGILCVSHTFVSASLLNLLPATVATDSERFTPFSLAFFKDFESERHEVVFVKRITNLTALSFEEGESHAAADDEVVDLIEQVHDDANLCRHLRTAEDSGERTLDIVEHVIDSFDLFLHEVAEHLVVFVEIVGDDRCRSMSAVSGTKGIVHIAVGIRCEMFGELFLLCLDFFLGSSLLVVSSIGSQTSGFAFLFSDRSADSRAAVLRPVSVLWQRRRLSYSRG
jgi:hypothetical protein